MQGPFFAVSMLNVRQRALEGRRKADVGKASALARVLAVLGCWLVAPALLAEAAGGTTPSSNTVIRDAPAASCKLLDDPALRSRMDGLLFNLLWSCGRQDELGKQPTFPSTEESLEDSTTALEAVDVLVNNPAGETGSSTTQSETSLAHNPVTGTYCSAFNDSYELFGSTGGGGLTGFARSTDGGVTWQDRGAVGATAFGDPSLVWRHADGTFYLATLNSGGDLAVWRSTDDCGDFTLLSIPSTGSDDKEILAVDNNPASPHYGNLYLVWTDFGVSGTPIRATRSIDGGVTWSAPVDLSAAGTVQGAWPAVAPNGDLFVAWLRYASWPNGNLTVEVTRSTNGGVTFAAVTSPLVNAVSPRDSVASNACGRPALNGFLRYLASPQIAVDGSGVLHVVYSHDPDTFNSGDVVNVYYRRSTNSGSSWSTPLQLNDVGARDQYFPTIQVNGSTLVAGWYDRRNDAGNLRQDYYKRSSTDGGVTWGANVRVSDVNSPIQLDPDLATCYHGDYDQSVVTTTGHLVQWSDDRNFVGSRNDPDVWSDAVSTVRNGMTWVKISHDSTYSVDRVACSGCNPYTGDTSCATSLPVLCVRLDGSPNPGVPVDFYNGWIGGHIHLTPAVAGTSLTSLAAADALCAATFGTGYGMAEFHHSGGGWGWQAYGNVNGASRFWVTINDQVANCWN